MRVVFNPRNGGDLVEVTEVFPGVGERDCHECGGSGWWDFGPPGTEGPCVDCKGTGKEFVSI